jgi:hypothetical protein
VATEVFVAALLAFGVGMLCLVSLNSRVSHLERAVRAIQSANAARAAVGSQWREMQKRRNDGEDGVMANNARAIDKESVGDLWNCKRDRLLCIAAAAPISGRWMAVRWWLNDPRW